MYALILVGEFSWSAVVPLVPTFAQQLHLSQSTAGLLAGSTGLAVLVVALPAGMLADRYGARRLTLVSAALMSGSLIAHAAPGLLAVCSARASCSGSGSARSGRRVSPGSASSPRPSAASRGPRASDDDRRHRVHVRPRVRGRRRPGGSACARPSSRRASSASSSASSCCACRSRVARCTGRATPVAARDPAPRGRASRRSSAAWRSS